MLCPCLAQSEVDLHMGGREEEGGEEGGRRGGGRGGGGGEGGG